MKEFNGEKFCKDIIELRGTDSQSAFAEKLGINIVFVGKRETDSNT